MYWPGIYPVMYGNDRSEGDDRLVRLYTKKH